MSAYISHWVQVQCLPHALATAFFPLFQGSGSIDGRCILNIRGHGRTGIHISEILRKDCLWFLMIQRAAGRRHFCISVGLTIWAVGALRRENIRAS